MKFQVMVCAGMVENRARLHKVVSALEDLQPGLSEVVGQGELASLAAAGYTDVKLLRCTVEEDLKMIGLPICIIRLLLDAAKPSEPQGSCILTYEGCSHFECLDNSNEHPNIATHDL